MVTSVTVTKCSVEFGKSLDEENLLATGTAPCGPNVDVDVGDLTLNKAAELHNYTVPLVEGYLLSNQ